MTNKKKKINKICLIMILKMNSMNSMIIQWLFNDYVIYTALKKKGSFQFLTKTSECFFFN